MPSSRQATALNRYRVDATSEAILMGWRETIALPDLSVGKMQAKLDSGAVVSSLHATQIERFRRRGALWLRFVSSCELTKQSSGAIQHVVCEAKWLQDRTIRSSNGQVQTRPAIETTLCLGGFQWGIEVTLNDRSDLECKLLLGRSAMANRCVIDCARSHLVSHP